MICRQLNFNLGNVFKYVFRRDGKECIRSLKSAMFYLKDHQDQWDESGEEHQMYLTDFTRNNPMMSALSRDLYSVGSWDTNEYAKEFYSSFRHYVSKGTYHRLHYQRVMNSLLELIASYEPQEGTEGDGATNPPPATASQPTGALMASPASTLDVTFPRTSLLPIGMLGAMGQPTTIPNGCG